jgi:hypothetical protein
MSSDARFSFRFLLLLWIFATIVIGLVLIYQPIPLGSKLIILFVSLLGVTLIVICYDPVERLVMRLLFGSSARKDS